MFCFSLAKRGLAYGGSKGGVSCEEFVCTVCVCGSFPLVS